MSDTKCKHCDDTRVIEVDYEGCPRSEWEALPIGAQVAYRMGLVEFTWKPCPLCSEDTG